MMSFLILFVWIRDSDTLLCLLVAIKVVTKVGSKVVQPRELIVILLVGMKKMHVQVRAGSLLQDVLFVQL